MGSSGNRRPAVEVGAAGVTLPPPALLLLAVIGVLWMATPAHAHRLDADYRVRPDGHVQVESWFDVGGKAPAGAKVQVVGKRPGEKTHETLYVKGEINTGRETDKYYVLNRRSPQTLAMEVEPLDERISVTSRMV